VSKNISSWGMLWIICFYSIAICIAFQSIPPILSLIIEDLKISHAQAGLIMSTFSLPGILLTIPAGFLSNKIGLKRTGIIAIILVILGSFILFISHNFLLLLVGRICIGIAGVTIPVVGLQGTARLFTGKRLGLAMGIYGATMSLGTVIPLLFFGAVGVAWGWRSTIMITIILGIIALVIFASLFRLQDEADTHERSKGIPFGSIFKIGLPVWIMAISWGLFGIANCSLLTFLPDFMYQNGIDLRLAGPVTSIIMICGVILSPVVGHLLDKSKYKTMFIISSGVLTSLLVFIMPGNINLILLFAILIGISTTSIGPTIFSITSEMSKSELLSLAFGLIFTFSNLGMFIGPTITGFIIDVTGTYLYSYWFLAALYLLLGLITIVVLRQEIRRRNLLTSRN